MGKAVWGLAKMGFIERWPSYRVAAIDRQVSLYMISYCTTNIISIEISTVYMRIMTRGIPILSGQERYYS